ncbi:hypothetical protein [Bosea sp. (in: a-proteobacteria)]
MSSLRDERPARPQGEASPPEAGTTLVPMLVSGLVLIVIAMALVMTFA